MAHIDTVINASLTCASSHSFLYYAYIFTFSQFQNALEQIFTFYLEVDKAGDISKFSHWFSSLQPLWLARTAHPQDESSHSGSLGAIGDHLADIFLLHCKNANDFQHQIQNNLPSISVSSHVFSVSYCFLGSQTLYYGISWNCRWSNRKWKL